MTRSRVVTVVIVSGAVLVALLAASPWIISGYWKVRSSNPVRRGMTRAAELGCFSCHGESGRAGVPIPGRDDEVPGWSGGTWMMYVKNDDDVRRYILEGSTPKTADHEHGGKQHGPSAIVMPAYGDVIDAGDLADLVATFKVLSGMSVPAAGSPARAGYDVARKWQCFSCHGPAASGGRANPGSFTGYIPGWYGADFGELVRDRQEFDTWIREGTLPRFSEHPIAKRFLKQQRIAMPAYRDFGPEQLDALWSYTEWLEATGGGHRGDTPW